MGAGNAIVPGRADDPKFPPGTVRLERLLGNAQGDTEIILQPRPTDDPNDPLNWPKWRKYLNFGLATFYAVMAFAQINATTPTWGPMEDELGFTSVLMYGEAATLTWPPPPYPGRMLTAAVGTTRMPLDAPRSRWGVSCSSHSH